MVFSTVVTVLVGLGFVTFFVGIIRASVRDARRRTRPYSGTHPTQRSTWQPGTAPYDVSAATAPDSSHHGGHHHGGQDHHQPSHTPTSSPDMGGGMHHHG
jgi:hypothetical protein